MEYMYAHNKDTVYVNEARTGNCIYGMLFYLGKTDFKCFFAAFYT